MFAFVTGKVVSFNVQIERELDTMTHQLTRGIDVLRKYLNEKKNLILADDLYDGEIIHTTYPIKSKEQIRQVDRELSKEGTLHDETVCTNICLSLEAR